jgi:hypothetical protein
MTVHYLPLPEPPPPSGQPCRVTFRSAISRDDEGNLKTISLNVTVENGDFQGIIDVVKEEGGLWSSSPEAGVFFLPWPCAYVEVHSLNRSSPLLLLLCHEGTKLRGILERR